MQYREHSLLGLHQDFVVVDNICGDLDFEDGGNPVVMNRIWAGTDPVLILSLIHISIREFCIATSYLVNAQKSVFDE